MSSIPDNNQPEVASSDPDDPDEPRCQWYIPIRWENISHQPWNESEMNAALENAVRAAAAHRGFDQGEIGILITDDPSIRELNARHLDHDYATDVISFTYSADPPDLQGELVVSLDTAQREAARLGWPAESELLLYVVHGVLHIGGMLDDTDDHRTQMRQAERDVMRQLGIDSPIGFQRTPERDAPAAPITASQGGRQEDQR